MGGSRSRVRGGMCAGPEGVRRPETGSGGAEEPGRSVRDFFVTVKSAGKFHQLFQLFDFLSIFLAKFGELFSGVLFGPCAYCAQYAQAPKRTPKNNSPNLVQNAQKVQNLEKLMKLPRRLARYEKISDRSPGSSVPPGPVSGLRPPPDRHTCPLHARPARPHSPSRRKDSP